MNTFLAFLYKSSIKIVLILAAIGCGVKAAEFGHHINSQYTDSSFNYVQAGSNGGAIAFGLISAACIIAFALLEINDRKHFSNK